MNIHQHHTIHICSACPCCPCCPAHCGASPSEPEPRPRSSILDALGSLARLAAMISLLRATADRSDNQTRAEQDPTQPLAPPTAETAARRDALSAEGSRTTTTAGYASTEPPNPDAFLALFSQAAREHELRATPADGHHAPPSTKVKPPLTPLATAFLAAFRDEPTRAERAFDR